MIVEIRRTTTGMLRDMLGDERFHELRDQGAAMDIDQAVAYALSHLDACLRSEDAPGGTLAETAPVGGDHDA